MTIKTSGPSDIYEARRQPDPAASYSWSDPDEGYRLMRSFLSIRQDALRAAIVEFVTQLSSLEDEKLADHRGGGEESGVL